MGERWMSPDRFRAEEIPGDVTVGEQAEAMTTARELEWLAAADDVSPSAGFADRVMAAIAAEPTPRPVTAAVRAARRGAVGGFAAALRDLWRVAWTGGRPLAVRAPAMALVVVLIAGTVGAGAIGAGALAGLLGGPDGSPTPPVASPSMPVLSPSPSPSPAPTADGTPVPSASPSPNASPSPSPSASPSSEPTRRPEPTRSPRPSPTPDDDDGTPRPSPTPDEDETPRPTDTPKPTETPKDD